MSRALDLQALQRRAFCFSAQYHQTFKNEPCISKLNIILRGAWEKHASWGGWGTPRNRWSSPSCKSCPVLVFWQVHKWIGPSPTVRHSSSGRWLARLSSFSRSRGEQHPEAGGKWQGWALTSHAVDFDAWTSPSLLHASTWRVQACYLAKKNSIYTCLNLGHEEHRIANVNLEHGKGGEP